MPSNKKMRSRAKKALAKAKQNGIDENFSLLLRCFQPQSGRRLECMHGYLPDDDNNSINIYDILNTVGEVICISEKTRERVGGAFEAARQATVDKYPSLYDDDETLGLLSQAFLCIGTELLLDGRAGTSTRFQVDVKAKNLFRCATFLAFAEYLSQYVKVKLHLTKPFFYYHKVHELVCSDERRMVSYTRKRIGCSCLDAKFLLVKSDKRISICNNLDCLQEKVELKALMTCERCKKAHYCSQKCQAADFDGHRFDCVGWKKWKKVQKKKTADKPQDQIVEV